MADGMAYLIDGDSGRYLGTLSTGYGFARINRPATARSSTRRKPISRAARSGKRTDVVTVYDAATFEATGELPSHRSARPTCR